MEWYGLAGLGSDFLVQGMSYRWILTTEDSPSPDTHFASNDLEFQLKLFETI